MARLLIQSASTGRFLAPSLDDGQPGWVSLLRDAGGGVVAHVDDAHQLVQEWCDPEDEPMLIDLDRLGTKADYMATGGVASVSKLPDGNHGDNGNRGGR